MALRSLHIKNLTQECIARADTHRPFWRKSLVNKAYRHAWVPTRENCTDVLLADQASTYIQTKLAKSMLNMSGVDNGRVLTDTRTQKFLLNTVFLDPGQKAFQTFYSPEGLCGTIGEGFADTIFCMAKAHDKLYQESCGRDVSRAQQQRMRLQCHMIRIKLRRKIHELHDQTISFLCNHFNHVFIPPYAMDAEGVGCAIDEYPYSQVFSKHHMALAIHHDFSHKLKASAVSHGTRVYMIGEEFTTKTCGCCGHIQTVGSQRVFNCQKCGLTIDRDLNAARNICLKALSILL